MFYDIKKGIIVNTTIPETIVIEPCGEHSWIWDMRVNGEHVGYGVYAVSMLRSNLFVRIEDEKLKIIRTDLLLEEFNEPTAYFTIKHRCPLYRYSLYLFFFLKVTSGAM